MYRGVYLYLQVEHKLTGKNKWKVKAHYFFVFKTNPHKKKKLNIFDREKQSVYNGNNIFKNDLTDPYIVETFKSPITWKLRLREYQKNLWCMWPIPYFWQNLTIEWNVTSEPEFMVVQKSNQTSQIMIRRDGWEKDWHMTWIKLNLLCIILRN